MYKGKIMWVSQKDGNGVILDEHNNEVYFDRSTFTSFNNCKRGDIVKFNINGKIKECLCAKDVKLEYYEKHIDKN